MTGLEIKLASFTVDPHNCEGSGCTFCKQFGVWESSIDAPTDYKIIKN